MQLPARARYSVIAMVDLATRQTLGCECGPVCLAEIAARQNLSRAYLEQLFGKLRRAGLVGSARGPGGGYRLARSSDAITIAEIISAVDGPIHPNRRENGSCSIDHLWDELGRQIRTFLEQITLADVVTGRVSGRAVPPDDGRRLAAE